MPAEFDDKLLIWSLYMRAFNIASQIYAQCQSVNYEAANWKAWFVDKPQQVALAAPPSEARAKAELQTINKALSKLEKKN